MTNILNCNSETEQSDFTTIRASNYHDFDNFKTMSVFTQKNHFKILSFNTESIASELDNLKIFIESLDKYGIQFDAICINECWLEYFGDDLNLMNYSAFHLSRKVGMKGGLITYLHKDFQAKEIDLYEDSKVWEGQFLEISGSNMNTKLLLGNIYVP